MPSEPMEVSGKPSGLHPSTFYQATSCLLKEPPPHSTYHLSAQPSTVQDGGRSNRRTWVERETLLRTPVRTVHRRTAWTT